jgi:hypothetical protein
MKPSEFPSAAETAGAAPRVPDYVPRNRLAPKWHPGAGTRERKLVETGDLAEPWMYSQRSVREHVRMGPAQRTTLWLLLATILSAAGLIAYSMSGTEGSHRLPLPAMQVPQHENRTVGLPDTPSAQATLTDTSLPAPRTEGGQQDMPPAAPDTETAALAGVKSASMSHAAPVDPAAAELPAPAAPAVVSAEASKALFPTALPVERGERARRSEQARRVQSGTECSPAQRAMQLCSVRAQ